MNPNMQRARKLGTNITHHHIGALPSQRPATWLEIQPKLRLFATNGTRCSSGGGCGTVLGMVLAVIIALLTKTEWWSGGAMECCGSWLWISLSLSWTCSTSLAAGHRRSSGFRRKCPETRISLTDPRGLGRSKQSRRKESRGWALRFGAVFAGVSGTYGVQRPELWVTTSSLRERVGARGNAG